jgi:hypothetical protein
MKYSDPYYEAGYHSVHHRALMSEDEYFWARAEVQKRFYFSIREQHSGSSSMDVALDRE